MLDLGERVLVLLRGINVGGHRSVPMPKLRALFAEFGCTEIATYIQSGNLVCTAPAASTFHPGAIAQSLAARFGFAVPVTLRTLTELDALIAANPFAAAPPETVHAVFFADPIAPSLLTALEAKRSGEEQLAPHRPGGGEARELFLSLPHGSGRSKLALAAVAPSVPGNPTARNWNTVLQLRTMLASS